MTHRTASCSCGQLQVQCKGEPVRVAICHCLECQKRTGSVYVVQARFHREHLTMSGETRQWSRQGNSGQSTRFRSCPVCASTVFCELAGAPGFVAVAAGMFADPGFPPPVLSVYEERRHSSVFKAGALPMDHIG